MTKMQVVLRRDREDTAQVVFLSEGDESGMNLKVFYLPRQDWDDMGQPEIITLDVVVGDRLN